MRCEITINQPDKSDWANLYQSAITFKEVTPWDWIDSDEFFAIENPDNGEVGYCSILGSGEEEFGLGMFLGDEGYDRYVRIIEEEAESEDFENIVMTRSISMLLVDRNVLDKQDREIIRSLGLSFRGRNAWPFFRSRQPGYAAWFLEKGEVLFLTAAIKQALIITEEVRSGKLDLLERVSENLILTRYYRDGKWKEKWRSIPVSNQRKDTNAEDIDAVKGAELYLIHNQKGEHSGVWELDIFILPLPIGLASDKPYFPICFLAVENKMGLILDTGLTEPWLTLSEKQDEVIQILKKAKQLPREIRVKSDTVRRIIEPITNILGIKLQITSIPILEQVKSSLYNHFSR